MGPDSSRSDLPSRPRFSWDVRNCPWTDGKGNQEGYAESVELWSLYHDHLPDNNSNKIPKNLRGIQLKSQLFHRAADLCRDIPTSTLVSESGSDSIVQAIYKRDPLSVVTDIFDDLLSLLRTRRGNTESFKNFESRFASRVSRYSAHGQSISLPESITALLLLANSNVADPQRVSVLSAASSKAAASTESTDGSSSSLSNDEIIKLVHYEAVASVIRQCDKDESAISKQSDRTMSGSYVNTGNNWKRRSGHNSRSQNQRSSYNNGSYNVNFNSSTSGNHNTNNSRRRMTRAELQEKKLHTQCHVCNKFGHWSDDHNTDGTVKDGVPSNDAPPGNAGGLRGLTVNRNSPPPRPPPNNGNVMHFGMAMINSTNENKCSSTNMSRNILHGPLVDDGAPYSALGVTELRILRSSFGLCQLSSYEATPERVAHYEYWQYGIGSHSSEKRRILGSVSLSCMSDNGKHVGIQHLVLEGASQWVLGRNVTRACNILHINDNRLQFPMSFGETDYITMVDDLTHSFVPLSRFTPTNLSCSNSSHNMAALVGHNAIVQKSTSTSTKLSRPLKEVNHIIRRVHDHVCGHASYGDMRTLLQRNALWNNDVQHMLSSLVEKCEHCRASAPPPSNRKVSVSGINRGFNEMVCVDHFYLNDLRLFHVMDSYSRFSSAQVVQSATLADAVNAFENTWISHFWPPTAVQGDLAFQHDEFTNYLNQYNIEFRPVPPRRHHKNLLEPKHGVIRSIFLRLLSASPDSHTSLLASSAVRISNELYGSDTLSSFEIAKGFTKPIDNTFMIHITPPELLEARDILKAKRKLTLLLRSHATATCALSAGDLVEVYIKKEKEKHGKWLSPRVVLSYDKSSGIVSVPGLSGRPISVAIEDIRHTVSDDEFASHVRESNDQLDRCIDASVDASTNDTSEASQNVLDEPALSTHQDSDFDHDGQHVSSSHEPLPTVGDSIEVYWPLDDKYYSGTVGDVDEHGQHVVNYADGEVEKIDLSNECWRSPIDLSASFAGFPSLQSNSAVVLKQIMNTLGQKPFMFHHAQGFPQYVITNAYDAEEADFKRHVKCIPISDVPTNANIISSHTVYKIKVMDDNSLKLKARIAPHGNEDSIKDQLRSDCCMCSPVGIRLVLAISALRHWSIAKADVKSAFLHTGNASRDVYVRPPRESRDSRHYWLLLAATYGLVNANAKFQNQADELIIDIGLSHMSTVPQLFYLLTNGSLVLVVVKIVDDLLMTGTTGDINNFLDKFNTRFKFGSVFRGPGVFKYYGLNITQTDDYSSSIHADDKLNSIECFQLSRVRRRQCDSKMNSVEMSSYMSVNSSIGWLGISASPFCAFYASHLQQKIPDATVSATISQTNYIRRLKQLGTLIYYPPSPRTGSSSISVLVFSDAGRVTDYGQLSYLAGILIGPFTEGSTFHTLSWMSHKSKRPVKSIGSAEILAAAEAIDEGKILKTTLSILLGINVRLLVALDSRDLFTSLSTQRNSIDKSIRADVNAIRYEYETKNADEIIWIPGRVNLTDPGTKADSPLTQALQLTMSSGKLSIDLSSHESRSSDRPLG